MPLIAFRKILQFEELKFEKQKHKIQNSMTDGK